MTRADADFDGDRPTVKRYTVGAQAERPQTNAPSSVFALTGATRITVGRVEPEELPIVKGPPPPRRQVAKPSRLARIFDLLKVDEGRAMTEQEGRSLQAWARQHGKKVIRRKAGAGVVHAWRAPECDEGKG